MRRILLPLFICALMVLPTMAQRNDSGGTTGTTPSTPNEYEIKNVNAFPGPRALGTFSVDYSGTNVGGIDWTRPFADGTCCSGLGPVKYTVQPFFVATTGAYNVGSVQDGWDGYLFVYQGSFDPLDQTANFVAGDDDGNGGIGTSDIEGVNLTAGTIYWVVTTGFENGEEGTFTNTIDGPGAITLGSTMASTPTLGEWGMVAFVMLLAATGMVVVRRRQVA